jgi:hypothetical protein
MNSEYTNLIVPMSPFNSHQLRPERVDAGAGVYLVGSWLQQRRRACGKRQS